MKHCPCFQKKIYQNCCQPFHLGATPNSAIDLMRSRFSAYALCIDSYIIDTTHSLSKHQDEKKKRWKNSIIQFCNQTTFYNLQVQEHQIFPDKETVTFKAFLMQDHNDVSFIEKSTFIKEDGKLKYLEGIFL